MAGSILFLFDIDGTLIKEMHSGESSGAVIFRRAMEKTFGVQASPREINSLGKTDKQILIELATLHGISKSEMKRNTKRALDEMNRIAPAVIGKGKREVFEGINELVSGLAARGVFLGVLTGNVKMRAETKLENAGLAERLEILATGDESEKRKDLVKLAVKRAEKRFKTKIPFKNVVVVGDTPLDIACGKVNRTKTLAFATGGYSLAELRKHHPTWAFENATKIRADELLAQL